MGIFTKKKKKKSYVDRSSDSDGGTIFITPDTTPTPDYNDYSGGSSDYSGGSDSSGGSYGGGDFGGGGADGGW